MSRTSYQGTPVTDIGMEDSLGSCRKKKTASSRNHTVIKSNDSGGGRIHSLIRP